MIKMKKFIILKHFVKNKIYFVPSWIALSELHVMHHVDAQKAHSLFYPVLYIATCELHHAKIKPCTYEYIIIFIPHPCKCIPSFYSAKNAPHFEMQPNLFLNFFTLDPLIN